MFVSQFRIILLVGLAGAITTVGCAAKTAVATTQNADDGDDSAIDGPQQCSAIVGVADPEPVDEASMESVNVREGGLKTEGLLWTTVHCQCAIDGVARTASASYGWFCSHDTDGQATNACYRAAYNALMSSGEVPASRVAFERRLVDFNGFRFVDGRLGNTQCQTY